MNKKGQDWLNITELIVVIFCLFFAFFFLNVSKINLEDEAESQLTEFRGEYHNMQSLRTFLQTPIVVHSKTMTVSQAINKHYEQMYISEQTQSLNNYDGFHIDYLSVIQRAAKDYLEPVIMNIRDVQIWIYFVSNDVLIKEKNLQLLSVIKYPDYIKFKPINLMIPAYFENNNQQIGSYKMYIGLGPQISSFNKLKQSISK